LIAFHHFLSHVRTNGLTHTYLCCAGRKRTLSLSIGPILFLDPSKGSIIVIFLRSEAKQKDYNYNLCLEKWREVRVGGGKNRRQANFDGA